MATRPAIRVGTIALVAIAACLAADRLGPLPGAHALDAAALGPASSLEWPNEPEGFTIAVDESFSRRDLSPQPAGPWEWGNGGKDSPLLTIEPARDGTAMRWTYPEGFEGGASPGRAVIAATDMAFRSLYIGILVRWSRPWAAHGSGANKIVYWGSMEARDELGHGPSQFYLNRRDDIIDLTLQYAQEHGQSNVPANDSQRRSRTPVNDGQWHQIELILDGNDAGRNNCRLRLWVDDWYEADIGDLLCARGVARFYGINLDPVWGGIGQNKPETDWMEIDHIRVSGRR